MGLVGSCLGCCGRSSVGEGAAPRFSGEGRRLGDEASGGGHAADWDASGQVRRKQRGGGEGEGDARSAAAAAAERRATAGGDLRNVSREKSEALKERRIKDELLGKIEHYYRQAGQEPPFGLASCSVETLKRQLEFAKTLSAVQRT